MQKQKKPVPEVVKPILIGSWHGQDAVKQGFRMMLNILFISVIYLILSLLLTFDALALRIITSLILIATATAYMYTSGMAAGQGDAAYGEIMYTRKQEGKTITPQELERSFHPAKGFFEVLIGAAPYLIDTLAFACVTSLSTYTLGVLPSWLTRFTRQSGIGDALAYYQSHSGMDAISVVRIVVRSMTLPFVNVATKLGDVATLWAERLSPLWVMVAPLGYAFGYQQGKNARVRINTGIAIGENKKKRRARREKREREKKNSPQQLV